MAKGVVHPRARNSSVALRGDTVTGAYPRRRSALQLAPLELDCMSTLWPLGEGTVRQIRDGLAATRPRAYTTIMTTMGRLERKGIVQRRKAGRGYVYRPALTAERARAHALQQMVESFFGGSHQALLAEVHRHCAAVTSSALNRENGAPGITDAAVPSSAELSTQAHVSR